MTDHKTHFANMKTVVTALLLTFLSVSVIFSVMIKKNQQETYENALKIDSLFSEVGELKQINDDLYGAYVKSKTDLASVKKILEKIDATVKDRVSVSESALRELNDANMLLIRDIQSKENSISDLAKKNTALKEELDTVNYSPEILDIAVIGHNSGLTDAIAIISVNPSTKKIAIISVPRDLYHKGRKINEIFNLYGIDKLKETLTEVTGIKVDKHVIFDFGSFISLIDSFGGIDINVEKGFTDDQYPGPDYGYVKVSFTAGPQHMDGAAALKYARSRKSTSDFDRSMRQQQVITALRDKISGFDVYGNFDALVETYESLKDGVKTDMNLFDMLALYGNTRGYSFKTGNVISNRNYLYTSVSKSGQYILLPVNGSYTELKKYVSNLVNT